MTPARLIAIAVVLTGTCLGAATTAVAADSTPGPISTSTSTISFAQDPVMAPTAVSPSGSMAYVATSSDIKGKPGAVQFIDIAHSALKRSVKVGEQPAGLAITPDGSRLAASSWQDRAVTIVDTRKGTVVKTIPVGGQPDTVFIGPKGSSLFAFLIDQGVVAKIDLKTYRVTGRIDTKIPGKGSCKKAWTSMAMTADSTTLLLSCSNGGLLFIDPAIGRVRGMAKGAGGGTPVFSPDGTTVYWGGEYYLQATSVKNMKNSFAVQLLRKGDGGVDGVEAALAVAVSKDGTKAYATMPDVGAVAVLDAKTGQEISRVQLNGKPYLGAIALTLSPDGSRLYATQRHGGIVTIDTGSDTILGVEPGPDPNAPSTSTTISQPAVNLTPGLIGRAWATFTNGDVASAGFSTVTMPAS